MGCECSDGMPCNCSKNDVLDQPKDQGTLGVSCGSKTDECEGKAGKRSKHRGDAEILPITRGLVQELCSGNTLAAGGGNERLLGIAKPIQIGGVVGGGGGGGGGGAPHFDPILLNGHIAGGIIFLDPQFQPAALVNLPFGFAGAIGKGAIGIGLAGLLGADLAGAFPGGGLLSGVGTKCKCSEECNPPKGCCPDVDVSTTLGDNPKTEHPKIGRVLDPDSREKLCKIYGKFSFSAQAHLHCNCSDDNNITCPKVNLGYLQFCKGVYRVSFANFADCKRQLVLECQMVNYQIDSAGYTVTIVGDIRTYTKKHRGELTINRDGNRVTELSPDCKDGVYKSLGKVEDAPGIYIDSLKVPPDILKGRGGLDKDWRPFKVEADLQFRTYVVTQCSDCKPENLCNWYPRLIVPWRMRINTTIKDFINICAAGATKGLGSLCDTTRIEWDLPNQNSTLKADPVERLKETDEGCPLLEEDMTACKDPSQWCNPFFRNMSNWHLAR